MLFRSRAALVLGACGKELHFLRDALPLGHGGRGAGALQLVGKGAHLRVAGQRLQRPGAAARRQVAGEAEELQLHLGAAEVLDQRPGLRLVPAALEAELIIKFSL